MVRQSDATKLLALGLLNYADDYGYFYATPAMVRAALRPLDEDSMIVRRSIDDLSGIGFVELADHPTHGLLGRVVSFETHQRVDRPAKKKISLLWSDSKIVRRLIDDRSSPEQGNEGTGNEGTGKGLEATPPQPLTDIEPVAPVVKTEKPKPKAPPEPKAPPAGADAPKDKEVTPLSSFIGLWKRHYQIQHNGEAYTWQDKDGPAAKRLVSAAKKTPDELIRVCIAAWKSTQLSRFLQEQCSSLCNFESNYNQIREALNRNMAARTGGAATNHTNGTDAATPL